MNVVMLAAYRRLLEVDKSFHKSFRQSGLPIFALQVLQGVPKAHQEARAKVTDARVEEFTKPRPMQNCLESQ